MASSNIQYDRFVDQEEVERGVREMETKNLTMSILSDTNESVLSMASMRSIAKEEHEAEDGTVEDVVMEENVVMTSTVSVEKEDIADWDTVEDRAEALGLIEKQSEIVLESPQL
jgi:hypothetical protein